MEDKNYEIEVAPYESMDQLSEDLVLMNMKVVTDGINEATLSGGFGFVILCDMKSTALTDGFQKTIHDSLNEILSPIYIDEEIVREEYDEVTPETVINSFRDQLNAFIGKNGLEQALTDEMYQKLVQKDKENKE